MAFPRATSPKAVESGKVKCGLTDGLLHCFMPLPLQLCKISRITGLVFELRHISYQLIQSLSTEVSSTASHGIGQMCSPQASTSFPAGCVRDVLHFYINPSFWLMHTVLN